MNIATVLPAEVWLSPATVHSISYGNMRPAVFNFLKLTLFSIAFWSIVMCFFVLLRFLDLDNEPGINIEEGFLPSAWQLSIFGITMGILIGIPYALIEILFDRILKPKIYLGLSILIRTISYLILLVITITLIMVIAEVKMGINLPNEPGWWRSNRAFWVFIAYFGLFSIVFSFLKIARERFGRGTFFRILVGKYAKPIEENRIFMFLDLKSSTTIAEQIGNLAYSAFIRDCFLDLNNIIAKFDAEIYQYVGDEAVLCWKYNKGIRRNNCVALFFEFQKRLQQRGHYYQGKFGLIPEFKAGLHGGKLVVVEVGSVKKDLAYHGDVINTAARIQGQCNKFGENLLVSGDLLRDMKIGKGYLSKKISGLKLRGKSKEMDLFSIRQVIK